MQRVVKSGHVAWAGAGGSCRSSFASRDFAFIRSHLRWSWPAPCSFPPTPEISSPGQEPAKPERPSRPGRVAIGFQSDSNLTQTLPGIAELFDHRDEIDIRFVCGFCTNVGGYLRSIGRSLKASRFASVSVPRPVQHCLKLCQPFSPVVTFGLARPARIGEHHLQSSADLTPHVISGRAAHSNQKEIGGPAVFLCGLGGKPHFELRKSALHCHFGAPAESHSYLAPWIG